MGRCLADRLSTFVGPGKKWSDNQIGKAAGVSPRTVANYRLEDTGASGPALLKIEALADKLPADPLWLLSDLSAASFALARAFHAFEHDRKEDVYRHLLDVLEGRAALILPEVRPAPGIESRPTHEHARGR